MNPDVVVRRFTPNFSGRSCTDHPTWTAPKVEVTRSGEEARRQATWYATGCDEHRDAQIEALRRRLGCDPVVEQR